MCDLSFEILFFSYQCAQRRFLIEYHTIDCLNELKFCYCSSILFKPCWLFDNNGSHNGVIMLNTILENNLGIMDGNYLLDFHLFLKNRSSKL